MKSNNAPTPGNGPGSTTDAPATNGRFKHEPEPGRGEGLHAALRAAQMAIQPLGKNARNTGHDYDYVSADAVIDACREALLGAGLLLIRDQCRMLDGPALESRFTLHHEASGQTMQSTTVFPVCPHNGRPLDKAMAAAMTSSLAYFLRDLLMVPRFSGPEMDSRDDARRADQAVEDTIGAEAAQELVARTHRAGRTIEQLRIALSSSRTLGEIFGDAKAIRRAVSGEPACWPSEALRAADRLLAKAEGRHKPSEPSRDAGSEDGPISPPDAPATPRGPHPGWVAPQRGMTPAHPAYWRRRMLGIVQDAIRTDPDDFRDADSAESVLRGIEERLGLPRPDEKLLAGVALRIYQAAFEQMRRGEIELATARPPEKSPE